METFGEHAERRLRDRNLTPRTRNHYRKILEGKLLPTFEDVALKRRVPPPCSTHAG